MNASIAKPALVAAALVLVAGCERPPINTEQQGFRGTAMVDVSNPRIEADRAASGIDDVPQATPQAPAGGPKAGDVYQNVQVLGDLSVAQFTRLMTAITQWVAPAEEGCNYCHEGANLASNGKYTKVVSRRMIQMTQHINSNWTDHVAQTGVTCYTCHRGNAVPQYIWFRDEGQEAQPYAGYRGDDAQNQPNESVAWASLPGDPFSSLIAEKGAQIRVAATEALPGDDTGAAIQDTERTYGLMMHMSDALGENCTYCHNSRAFANWEESSPKRVTAWHGIHMAQNLNANYLEPLRDTYPDYRLGKLGDAPKANCMTCHQGNHKPLGGGSMVYDYPSLRGN